MANRRMFSREITDSDKFLDMPLSTQALYFHLGMNADDDGFIGGSKKIQRMVGCNDDDLKLLIVKSFIIPFENGVLLVSDWKVNNQIRKDRYHETIYTKEKAMILQGKNNQYYVSDSYKNSVGIPMVNQMETEVSLGKVSLGKVSLEKEIVKNKTVPKENIKEIIALFNETCVSLPRVKKLSKARERNIKTLLKNYTLEEIKELFLLAQGSSFLTGKNDRNWKSSFDWLIKDTNAAKVLDGNYKDKIKQTFDESDYKMPDYGTIKEVSKESGAVW